MPRYDYLCASGHIEEQKQERDVSLVPCSICGDTARRVIMEAPYTITESGSVNGPVDRNRRTSTGEKLEQLRKTSVETKRQTGKLSGPFYLRDWEK